MDKMTVVYDKNAKDVQVILPFETTLEEAFLPMENKSNLEVLIVDYNKEIHLNGNTNSYRVENGILINKGTTEIEELRAENESLMEVLDTILMDIR